MAAVTLTVTGGKASEVALLGKTIMALAQTAQVDNKAVGTFTIADTATAAQPWTITSVDAKGTTRTVVIGA